MNSTNQSQEQPPVVVPSDANKVYTIEEATSTLLLLISTGMIVLMHAGFALLETGSVRAKNSKNILLKNMLTVIISVFAYWTIGYAVAFGTKWGKFIGGDVETFAAANFDHSTASDHYASWIFQFSFAATASTIVSGSLAERTRLPTYALFSALMSGIIYPTIVAWTWGGGWLGGKGFADFAGCGIVHMVGGVCGFVGTAILGERVLERRKKKVMKNEEEVMALSKKVDDSERFLEWMQYEADGNFPYEFNSIPFIVLGTIMLWVSWLFFNGGSTVDMFQPRNVGTPKIMMNTIISGAAGGLVAVWVKPLFFQSFSTTMRYDICALCNGVLGGCVSVTGGCNNVQPWAAFIIGCIGGVVYSAGARLCVTLNVDDPIEASAVHGFCGIWGLIAVGLFDNTKGVLYGTDVLSVRWQFLMWQVIGMLAIAIYVAMLAATFFFLMNCCNQFRVPLTEEVLGLDIAEMDESALPHINEKVVLYTLQQAIKTGDTSALSCIAAKVPIKRLDENDTPAKVTGGPDVGTSQKKLIMN